ncbi:hypothetical protein EYF80_037490 [Liparis tanakae]|uniref:Uncharacterized protein n=1 Tax=Liparis tanakae TaxID=230148 RepID=A0A4Z2GFP0_9TELE|nr:hypothetical protein EYF80_037490 [Liparis tanakae]
MLGDPRKHARGVKGRRKGGVTMQCGAGNPIGPGRIQLRRSGKNKDPDPAAGDTGEIPHLECLKNLSGELKYVAEEMNVCHCNSDSMILSRQHEERH